MSDQAKPRCDGCQFWSTESDEGREADGMKVQKCTKALHWWDATKWSENEDPGAPWREIRTLLPEAVGTKMFTQDASDYRAELLTAADFFCAHHTPIAEAVP